MDMITETEITEPQKWTLQSVGLAIWGHIQKDRDRDDKMEKVYQATFIGNGHKSIRAQLDDHEQFIADMKKFLWLIVGAVIVQVITSFFTLVGVALAIAFKW